MTERISSLKKANANSPAPSVENGRPSVDDGVSYGGARPKERRRPSRQQEHEVTTRPPVVPLDEENSRGRGRSSRGRNHDSHLRGARGISHRRDKPPDFQSSSGLSDVGRIANTQLGGDAKENMGKSPGGISGRGREKVTSHNDLSKATQNERLSREARSQEPEKRPRRPRSEMRSSSKIKPRSSSSQPKSDQRQAKAIQGKGKENYNGKRYCKEKGMDGGRKETPEYSCSTLKELLTAGTDRILEEVTSRKFHRFLNNRRVYSDQLSLALELIIVVMQRDEMSPANSLHVLSIVADSRLLDPRGGLEGSLSHVSNQLPRQSEDFLRDLFTNVLFLLKELLTRIPNRSFKAVERILGGLRGLSCKMVALSNRSDQGIRLLTKVTEMQRLHGEIEGLLAEGERVQDEPSWLPPNDFRGISVMPTQEDLEDDEPFLKENRMNGYESTLQYLDTQFRLMREDLLAPLREGIKEHLQNVRDRKFAARLQDCCVYRDVQFLGVDTKTEGSLAYVVRFNVTNFRHVQWENTKRLMYGNMVCLSADDFKTVYFATIVDREPKGLRRGLLTIKIEGITTLSIAQRVQSFVMLEATSYLEAYKYVLARLQSIGMDIEAGKEMPFQRYVVDCEVDINPPDYLDRNTTITIPTADGKEKNIIALNEGSWARVTPDNFNLDDSQFEALKHTLLSEMTLIQGPPGTGKTFIGLKIMDILLKNKNIWKGLHNRGHIMVICFTNHALDQFLEGVLELQMQKPSLVRIGGRCKTESLAKYNLKELRHQYRRSLPGDWWDSFKAVKDDIKCKVKEIKEKKHLVSLEALKVPAEWLKQYMTHMQFMSFYMHCHPETFSMTLDQVLMRWLSGWDGLYEETWQQLIFSLHNSKEITEDKGRDIGAYQVEELDNDYQMEMPATKKIDQEDNDSDSDGSLISVAGEAELIQSGRIVDDGYKKGSDLYQEYIERENEEDANKWTKQRKGKKGLKATQHEGRSKSSGGKTAAPNNPQFNIEQILQSYQENAQKSATPLDPDMAERIVDVWRLNQKGRFGLFLHWCDSFFQNLDVALAYDLQEQEELANELQAISLERDCQVIGDQDVMGMTTTGAAKYAEIVQRVRPQIVIVEEAAEVLEAHIVTALTDNCKHLILIGDHKQLRPNPTVYELARDYRLNISLFERMIENNMNLKTLRLQHRMRPDISQFLVPWIYEELVDHDDVKAYPSIRGIQSNVVYLDHDRPENGSSDSRSHSNDFEADFVVGLCKYFLQQEYEPSQITILTTYTGQMFKIREKMPKAVFEGVRVTPVDNYQGEENDIIILSFVRSNDQRNIGFLREPNRVCVAMSRAKMGFYAFGNFSMYASKTETWKGMVGDMEKQGLLKKSLTVLCQNHPETITEIATAGDFKTVPDGGCLLSCDFKLKCGHVCTKKCHPKDAEHKEYKCKSPCGKMCKKGVHKCRKKCWIECRCTAECPEVLECGHQCQNACSEQCTTKCMAACDKELSCGHNCLRRCSEGCKPCVHACEQFKPCGHGCPGRCGQDCNDVACKALCSKILDCGHTCPKKCFEPCPPCNQSCRKRLPCGHQCKNTCSSECTTECGDRCQKDLPCGHRCLLRCGEDCEIDCKISVVKVGPCEHRIRAPCNVRKVDDLAKLCTMFCNKSLPCDHKCASTCGKCSVECRKICSTLVEKQGSCGHMVTCRCDEAPNEKICTRPVFHFPKCGHIFKVECRDREKAICTEEAKKKLPCKHEATVKCNQDVNDVKCKSLISLDPGCGHEQSMKCFERRSFKCGKEVNHAFKCGHNAKIKCHKKETVTCLSECQQNLACGHKCRGTCGQCLKGGKHASCREKCTKQQDCGHPCDKTCGHQSGCGCQEKCTKKQLCSHPCEKTCGHERTCGPCRSRCEVKCWHRPCRKKCNEGCTPCEKQCNWRCPHARCTRLCHETCNRDPCNEHCLKKLPSCGHLCPGLCGEPCPFTCIQCHPTMFKNTNETTRYIRVQPCNHTLPVDVMDESMKEKQSGTFTVVEPKQCPADGCGRVVLFCPRYSNVIKAYLKTMRGTGEGKKWLRCRRCSEVSSFNKDDMRPRCRNC
ncbi:NFX1-type zinc finger-containing protein 1-like [Lineus longissimus]|uniref:NFX1-type zinc finger-containing protein 1-like n=1 Tax=Lineus longissimus TaxID=88925 RepID=UPI00315D88F7